MTLPRERAWATIQTEEFLYSLLDPKKTPRVPKEVRKEAARLLRHYPRKLDIELASEKAPNIFSVKED